MDIDVMDSGVVPEENNSNGDKGRPVLGEVMCVTVIGHRLGMGCGVLSVNHPRGMCR